MSFIDLMSNDIWTEADILRRTESMIRSEFSLESESILNRKATAATLDNYTLSEDEIYELVRYTAVAENARVEYQNAVKDMHLLHEVFKYEEAERVLSHMTLVDALAFVKTPRLTEIVNEETGEVVNQEELSAYDTTYNGAVSVISLYGDDIARNKADREEAQSVIDSASEGVKQVVEQRKTRI